MKVVVAKPMRIQSPAQTGTSARTVGLYTHMPPTITTSILGTGRSSHSRKHFSPNTHLETFSMPTWLPGAKMLFRWTSGLEWGVLKMITLAMISQPMRRRLATHARQADIVVAELPYLAPLLQKHSRAPLIYSAHDVEYDLRSSTLPNTLLSRWMLKVIRRAEGRACRGAAAIIASTSEDKARFIELYDIPEDRIAVIPNGVDTDAVFPSSNEHKAELQTKAGLTPGRTAIFVGSLCEANRDAADFIVNKLAPELSQFSFIIAGGIAGGYSGGTTMEQGALNNVLNLDDDLTDEELLGFGWYPPETWPGKHVVRWTRPEFGWTHKGAIAGFPITALSFKPVTLTVFVNDALVGTLSVDRERADHTIRFATTHNPVIKCVADSGWQYRGDPREFGVNVASVLATPSNEEQGVLPRLVSRGVREQDNVLFISNLSNGQKNRALQLADIGLNPIALGSGSNVKMFEYLAAGLPTVTTKFGARGLRIDDGTHAVVRGFPRFKESLVELAHDTALQQRLATHGRQYMVDTYDWRHASRQFSALLVNLAGTH